MGETSESIFVIGSPDIDVMLSDDLPSLEMAKQYYGIDFDSADYHICGWFNWNEGGACYDGDDPRNHPEWFHDHMKGTGSPVFHGYYAVSAEPTQTFYHINRDVNNLAVNDNIDNRLVVSETGHPHAIGNWDWDDKFDKARITIAYDISPKNVSLVGENFVGPHWIKL